MNNNEIFKQYGFLGIGQFGGNATRAFESAGYPCICANSSSEDLAQVKNCKNKIHFNGGSGCHKDRLKSKELLKNNIEPLINQIQAVMPSISTLFIIASAGGGTGSGALPATAKILRNALDINISVITVLPSKSEQFKAYANTIELFRELERLDGIGATFILDNSKGVDRLKVNEIFYTHLSSLLANENGSERGVIDRGEVDELLRTSGMAVISKLNRDNSDTQKLLLSLKTNNVYAPIEADRVIKLFGLMYSGNNISTEEIYSDLGSPLDEYIGFTSNGTVSMAAGLSYPKSRLREITKTAQANSETIKRNMEAVSDSLFDDNDISFLHTFDIKKPAKAEKKTVSSLDILNEFF